MGTNNFETKNPGDVISASDPNQYKTGLSGTEVVPRNSSGVPTDVAGGLGTTLYRWATSYINKIFFGTAAQECSIENDGTNLKFKIATIVKSLITADGYDGDYVKIGTGRRWQLKVVTSSQNITLPNDTDSPFVMGCGGGGGGGTGQTGNDGTDTSGTGGGGGLGAGLEGPVLVKCAASDVWTVAIGAGGAAATNGDPTTVSAMLGSTAALYFPGGVKGANGSAGGAGGSTHAVTAMGASLLFPGGAGGIKGVNGSDGTTVLAMRGGSITGAAGGVFGVNFIYDGGGGGGGGGSSSFGIGGAGGVGGGNNGTPLAGAGSAPAAGHYGAGGGGGGGGSEQSTRVGGAGGAGHAGVLLVFCLTATAWEGTV